MRKWIYVEFWDHATGRRPLFCDAIGELVEDKPKSISIRCWTTYDETGEAMRDAHNEEVFTILKSAITRKKRVKV